MASLNTDVWNVILALAAYHKGELYPRWTRQTGHTWTPENRP
jgi:hypothetical protein